jgi:hypothetical protein
MCLHHRGMTTGAHPHQQQLHRHPGTTAATPPPTPAAKSSHDYNSSTLIFMSRRYTNNDRDSTPTVPNYNSSPTVYHNLCIENFQICIFCLLYGRIRQLDPSPSFDDAVRQFVMVNFTKK